MKPLPFTLNYCWQPWSNLFLHNSGRIQPCCMNSTKIGDIYTDSINDIWNGEKITDIRKKIIGGDYEGAGCKPDCPVRHQIGQAAGDNATPWFSQRLQDTAPSYRENVAHLRDALKNKKCHVSHFPLFVDVQPTEACNMACIMCHQHHNKREGISTQTINGFLTWTDRIHTLRFQGGEIFIDQAMPEYLIQLKKKLSTYQQLHVITNGSLIGVNAIDALMAPPNPVHFIVSVDAVERHIYEGIRRSNRFEKVWQTLTYMAKKQKKLGRNDIVQWNYVVMRSNFFDVKQALAASADLGVKIFFQPILGDYPEQNFFMYPSKCPENAAAYIKECTVLMESLSVKNQSLVELSQIFR